MIEYKQRIRAAYFGGVSLFIMAIIAPIADFNIIQGLVDNSDAFTTLDNIESSKFDFRLATFFFLLVGILDILVAWALYLSGL